MRIRYLSYIALALAAAFLVVATAVFPLSTVVELTLGVGIGMLIVSLGIAERYRDDLPSVLVGVSSAVVSAWMIVASQVFSASTVDDITFASALVVGALTLIGLTAHEFGAERVVHSLHIRSREPEPVNGPRPSAA
jgi:amino acid transporter